jgi:hypothetical protein
VLAVYAAHDNHWLSANGLWCRSEYDLTCCWPVGDHGMAAPVVARVRSLSR